VLGVHASLFVLDFVYSFLYLFVGLFVLLLHSLPVVLAASPGTFESNDM
jgi:hypothetical protein